MSAQTFKRTQSISLNMAPEQSSMFACLLGVVLFAAVGIFELTQARAYGTCLIQEPGLCIRSCPDDIYAHCTYSPVYYNTSFEHDGWLKTCDWHTTPIFSAPEFCQGLLRPLNFTGPCAELAGVCVDGLFARGGLVVGATMLIISGCYTIFFTAMCCTFWQERTLQTDDRLLRAVRLD